MDIKWKKWKNRIGFILFFIGVSSLIMSATMAGYQMIRSRNRFGEIRFGYQDDYQELETFYSYINEKMESCLMIANGTYIDWSAFDYTEDYYNSSEGSTVIEMDYPKITEEELEAMSPDERDEYLDELQGDYYYQGPSNIPEEKYRQMAENYLKYEQTNQNLLYQITKDGKVLYTNISGEFHYGDTLPEGYNYIMHFDGEKVYVSKDGKEIDVYGDGVYNDDKDYAVPGYMNYEIDESLRNVKVSLIAIKTPVEYRRFGNVNGYNYYYDGTYSIYHDMLNGNASQEESLFFGIIGLILLICSIFLWKNVQEEKRLLAVLLNKIWIEAKILLLLVIFAGSAHSVIFWNAGYEYAEMVEYYIQDYGSYVIGNYEAVKSGLTLLLANPLICVALFWILYFLTLDISRNHRNKQNGIILKLLRGFNDRSLLMDFTKRQIRRVSLLILMCVIAFAIILFSAILIGSDSGDEIICIILFLISAAILISAFSWYCRTVRAQATDLDMLNGQIERISKGEYEPKKMSFAGQDFAQTEENLLQIQNGIRTAFDEQLMSERMKVDLVANVSHDLKTPLTSIISYIQFLKEEENLPDHLKDYIRILDEKSARLNEMVQDVFSISKATSGQLPVQMEILDFGKLLNQTLADMEETILQSSIVIKSDICEHEFYITADGQRMYRVCQNLIQNALKYSLEGSRVYISLEQQQNQAVAIFKNTSKEELDQEMDFIARFVRGDKSRTDGGSGLGLSIAQSFTEACGGQFSISINGDMFIVTISFAKQ